MTKFLFSFICVLKFGFECNSDYWNYPKCQQMARQKMSNHECKCNGVCEMLHMHVALHYITSKKKLYCDDKAINPKRFWIIALSELHL